MGSVVTFNNGTSGVRYGDAEGNWDPDAPTRLANFITGKDVDDYQGHVNDSMIDVVRPINEFWRPHENVADLEIVTGKRVLGISLGQWLVKYPGPAFYRVLSHDGYIAQQHPDQLAKPFKTELENLLNKHSWNSKTNMPDFILAGFMQANLRALESAVGAVKNWEGASTE